MTIHSLKDGLIGSSNVTGFCEVEGEGRLSNKWPPHFVNSRRAVRHVVSRLGKEAALLHYQTPDLVSRKDMHSRDVYQQKASLCNVATLRCFLAFG